MAKRKFRNLEEADNTRKAIIFILLTIAVGVFLFFLGIPAIGKFAAFVSSLRGNNAKVSSSDITPPPPPKFKYFPEFTNQANITLSGNTEAGAGVKLVFNGDSMETLADSDGQFTFSVALENGVNTFAATAVDQTGNQSSKSDDYQITFDNKPPTLEITSPSDGSTFYGSGQRQVTISGKTEAKCQVNINGRLISVDEDGNFQYTTTLNEGGNTFEIKSTDQAGNSTDANITLNFNP